MASDPISVALATPVASPLPTKRPWALPPSGMAVFYGRPETPRLFHYFLPRLLAEGKQVLCLDGANRFDPLLIARLARQRGREVDAYAVDNPHAASYVMAYVPDARLGIVSDLYVPGAPVPSSAMVKALVISVDKWGVKPERFAGGHGSTGPYADVVQAAQK